MNLKKSAQKIFTNSYFLYFMLILTLLNILGYLVTSDFQSILIFITLLSIIMIFEKNMSVVLTFSLLFTIFFNVIINNRRKFMEGMDGMDDNDKKKKLNNVIDDETENNQRNQLKEKNEKMNENKYKNHEKVEGANEKLINNGNSKNRIDLAATLEESYDNLNSILGSEGINKLTSDTNNLMKEQKKLYESMQMMEPLIQKAKQMMEGFDMKQINNMVNTASSFINQRQK